MNTDIEMCVRFSACMYVCMCVHDLFTVTIQCIYVYPCIYGHNSVSSCDKMITEGATGHNLVATETLRDQITLNRMHLEIVFSDAVNNEFSKHSPSHYQVPTHTGLCVLCCVVCVCICVCVCLCVCVCVCMCVCACARAAGPHAIMIYLLRSEYVRACAE